MQDITVRELEVLKLMADGHTNAEVAGKLFISIETVKSHVRHLLEKSGCRTRTHLVAFALRNSLIT